MSVEDLLKVPREVESRRILNIDYYTSETNEISTFDCDSDLISSVESYYDWLFAFVEHYKQKTGEEKPKMRYNDGLQQYEVSISGEIAIKFRVDTSKKLLQFFYGNKNIQETRDLVDSFIDIIWNGTEKIQTQGDAALQNQRF